mgnify:FL=1
MPTFDETSAFRDDLDLRVSQYLGRHPDVSSSSRVSQFAFARRVAVGMSKEEVVLLIGPPVATTQGGARMQEAAKQFWPRVRAGGGSLARLRYSERRPRPRAGSSPAYLGRYAYRIAVSDRAAAADVRPSCRPCHRDPA